MDKLNNKDRQKKFRQSQKAKGLVELRGVWVKPEDREKARKIINKYLTVTP